MKKEMESPNVKETSGMHDALLVKSEKLFSAIFCLPLKGGKIDTHWLHRSTDTKVTSIEKNSRPRRRYNKRYGPNSSRSIFMAHFSDERSSDLAFWCFNGERHILWPYTSINFGVSNCCFLCVASTALPWGWSWQFVLFCSKSLTRQRKQQHFG